MRRLLLGLFLLLALRSPATAADDAEWTILVYWDADNELEAASMASLEDMLSVGGPPGVNLIALVDRHPSADADAGYTDAKVGGLSDWVGGKYLRVEEGRLRLLEDLGETDMGARETLEDFVRRGVEDYPARRYALVFGDHGMSWPGTGSDQSNGDSHLDLQEIVGALSAAAPGPRAFELIGFDNCLMANLEVAAALVPHAKVLVASEELEPASGWAWSAVLRALEAQPSIDGATLGRRIADTYLASFTTSEDEGTRAEGEGVTMSVIDLTKVQALLAALGRLGDGLRKALESEERPAFLRAARARSRSESYGVDGNPDEALLVLHDLGDLCASLQKQGGKEAAAAMDVRTALRAAVVHSVHGAARPAASGLSIWFPPDADTLEDDTLGEYPGAGPAWPAFLAAYVSTDAEDSEDPDLGHSKTSAEALAAGAEVTVSSKVRGEDIDEVRFVLARREGNQTIVLGSVPAEVDDDGSVSEDWDGRWFAVSTGGSTPVLFPIIETEETDDESSLLAYVPAQVRRGKAWHTVTLTFHLTFGEDAVSGEFVNAFEFSRAGAREITLRPGDQVRPEYVVLSDDGPDTLAAPSDPALLLRLPEEDALEVSFVEVPPGEYLVGFSARDLAGNEDAELTSITVE